MTDKEEARRAELSASGKEGREKLIDRLFSFFVGGPKEHDHRITEEGRGKKGRRYPPHVPPPGDGGGFGGGGDCGGGGFGGFGGGGGCGGGGGGC